VIQNHQKDVSNEAHLKTLEEFFKTWEQYNHLKDDIGMYKKLHNSNQRRLLGQAGFSLEVKISNIPGAGRGVFVKDGQVKEGDLVCLYPGTVYQPHHPILIQSLGNQFIFRCCDGTLIDGSHGWISRSIFRSCTGRDQIGMIKIADTSWLTDYPVNPMNIGQIVNNANDEYSANVHYQELDIPNTFPLLLRKFLPNIKYESSGIDNELKIVYLQAIRDISKGEELFSTYFTLVR